MKIAFCQFCQIGEIANELNRDLGLVDLVPEFFTPIVVNKLRFIHEFTQQSLTDGKFVK